MKRGLLIILSIFLMLVFCSCHTKEVTQDTIVPNQSTTNNNPEITESELEITQKNITISNSYSVKCPVLNSDDFDYSATNTAIEECITLEIEQILDGTETVSELTTEYTIALQSSDTISILYTLYFNSQDSAHPVDFAFGINTNHSGETLTLQDILAVDQQLVSDFKTAWSEQTDEILQNYLDTYTDESLLELFIQMDSPQSNVHFYMTGDAVVIIFPIPRAAGSYVTITLSNA